ncbi:hypothetical protein PTKIN_Ptkin13bG0017800 [Pterospermum kingtungense]
MVVITVPGGQLAKQNHHYYKLQCTGLLKDQAAYRLREDQTPHPQPTSLFSLMKLFNRFRKILMRLSFSLPSAGSSGSSSSMATKQNNCDRIDPPKTSCSSYYSSHSHYSEAIADCIEFFNKSSQDGRKSDVWV